MDHGSEKCARIGPAILVPSKMEVWLDYLTRLVGEYIRPSRDGMGVFPHRPVSAHVGTRRSHQLEHPFELE